MLTLLLNWLLTLLVCGIFGAGVATIVGSITDRIRARHLSRLPKPPEPLELAKDEIADESGAYVPRDLSEDELAFYGGVIRLSREIMQRELPAETPAQRTDRILDAPDKPATVEPKRIA